MKRIILPLLLLLPFAAYAQQKSMSKTIADCFLDRFPDPAVIHNVGKTNIVDWQGHRNPRKGPHILHVSRDKRILESFGDNPAYVTVSSIFVPGRADSAH